MRVRARLLIGLLFLAALVAVCPGLLAAKSARRSQASGEADLLRALTALEQESWAAWQRRDGAFFERFLSDDHVEVGIGGPASKATVVAGVASPACIVKSYSVDTFKLTTFDTDAAVLTYHAQQDTTCGGVPVPSPVWTSSLYVRRAGRWQNALYQQTKATK